MKRIAVAGLSVLATFAFAAPVLAAAPSNDTYGARTAISALPYSDSLDTNEATTDADDAEANPAECGAPATDASVWYEVTGADAPLLVDVSNSDYAAGIIVSSGSPGSFALETCGPGGVLFFAAAGVTYSILAFDDQLDGTGTGGQLEIRVEELPPPPTVDLTVDASGKFNAKTGVATISGTVSCDDGAFVSIELSIRQAVGRFAVSGFGYDERACDGTAQPWSLEVYPQDGLFKGGKVHVDAFAYACSFDCGYDEQHLNISLRR